jgi:hypothetical protein
MPPWSLQRLKIFLITSFQILKDANIEIKEPVNTKTFVGYPNSFEKF